MRREEGKPDLLYIDLHLVHEVTSAQAFEGLRLAGRKVRRPDLTLRDGRPQRADARPRQAVAGPALRRSRSTTLGKNAEEFGVPYFGVDDRRQGIVHVIGPEQGLTQPGMTIVCGDSHTSTHGAFGALAFGIGTSEVEHVLATQTLPQATPKTMAVEVNGALHDGVTAKDVILAIIRKIGVSGGIGHVIEYRGDVDPRALDGRPHDGLQHVDRGRRARRPRRAGRHDVRLRRGPHLRAEGRRLGAGARRLARAADRRRRRRSTRTVELRRRGDRAVRDVGHDAGAERAGDGPRARPGRLRRPARARAGASARSPTWT